MNSCKYCGCDKLYTQEKTPHLGLYCSNCGKFQKWVRQEHNVETGEIASDMQQKYAIDLLRQWKAKNAPMTTRQAGAIISAFKNCM